MSSRYMHVSTSGGKLLLTSDLSTEASLNPNISLAVEQEFGLRPFLPSEILDYSVQLVLSILIIIVNGLVMYVLATTASLYTPAHMIIWGLALSDFSLGLCRPLQALLEIGILKNYTVCLFSYCSTVSLSSVSMMHLTIVSVDRNLRIQGPFRYKDTVTKRRILAIIVFVWVHSFVIGFMPMMGFLKTTFDGSVCVAEAFMLAWYFYCILGITFGICAIVLSCVYFKIYRVARKKRKLFETKFINRGYIPSSIKHLRAAKLLALLCVYFVVSWSPFFLLRVMKLQGLITSCIPVLVERVCVTLAVGNSLGNPLLYAYGERSVRTAMKKILLQNRTRNGTGNGR